MKHLVSFTNPGRALAAILTLAWMPLNSHALEILHWERMPLTVPLLVGQERVIFIDKNIRVGVPASVGDRLRVQSAGGAIYLKASAPIETSRIQLQEADTGALILIDVAALPAKDGQVPLEPVRIVDDEPPAKRYGNQADTSAKAAQDPAIDTPEAHERRETPIPVVLTRYAAQNLYAPLRTVESVIGIGRVSLRRNMALDQLLPALPLRAAALASWRLEDQWVTAVRLTNTSGRWLTLDPRGLKGDFVAATFQHPDLGPAGAPSDTTVVYLVTRRHGLAESLLPNLSPIDAALNQPAAASAVPSSNALGDRHEK